MIANSQHGLTKRKLGLSNVAAFSKGITGLVDKGRHWILLILILARISTESPVMFSLIKYKLDNWTVKLKTGQTVRLKGLTSVQDVQLEAHQSPAGNLFLVMYTKASY